MEIIAKHTIAKTIINRYVIELEDENLLSVQKRWVYNDSLGDYDKPEWELEVESKRKFNEFPVKKRDKIKDLIEQIKP